MAHLSRQNHKLKNLKSSVGNASGSVPRGGLGRGPKTAAEGLAPMALWALGFVWNTRTGKHTENELEHHHF